MNQPGLLLRVRFFGDDEGARLERGEEKEARENPRQGDNPSATVRRNEDIPARKPNPASTREPTPRLPASV